MKKEKILLIAGCSHAAGSEIDGTQDSVHNRNFSYGNQFAQAIGYRPLNIAMLGATNSSIARSVLKWAQSEEYDPEKVELAVLICWTESNRIEIPWHESTEFHSGKDANKANWFDVTANGFLTVVMGNKGASKKEKETCRDFQRFMVENQTFMELQTVNNILMMQYFFKAKNIKYMMCNSMHTITHTNQQIGYYYDFIDDTKYIGSMSMANDNFYWKYRNLGYSNANSKYWHHDVEPHDLFAKDLIRFNEDNECL